MTDAFLAPAVVKKQFSNYAKTITLRQDQLIVARTDDANIMVRDGLALIGWLSTNVLKVWVRLLVSEKKTMANLMNVPSGKEMSRVPLQ